MGSFDNRSTLLTAVSVVARAWFYRLRRRHVAGFALACVISPVNELIRKKRNKEGRV